MTTTLGTDCNGIRWLVQTDYFSINDIKGAAFYVLAPKNHRNKEKTAIGSATLEIIDKKAKLDIQIADHFQNRQIGTLLLRFIENWAITHGIKVLHGDIVKKDSNHFTQLNHFYVKLGFKFELLDASRINGDIVGHIEKSIGN